MKEIGIDISNQSSKSLTSLKGEEMDIVVTLCDDKTGICPVYPWAKEVIHAGFDDPGEFSGDDEMIRAQYRILRDEILHWIDEHLG
jgi:Protein-tyrosine-phosphatase